MTPSESLACALHEHVSLVPYDPRWHEAFVAEQARLSARFAPRLIEIRHFGSTSVPGLSAKPVIDLIAGVATMADARALVPELCEFDYHFDAVANAEFHDRRWLFRHRDGHRTHQLHLVEHGGQAWRERLAFCAMLRGDSALRDAYARLKHDIADRVGGDRDRYNARKRAFVRATLRGAARETIAAFAASNGV